VRSTEVAFAAWRRLDCVGEETCRLLHAPSGWMLAGHARFNDGHRLAALDYVVRCSTDWVTQSADISGLIGGDSVGWHITHDPGGWAMNGRPHPELAKCTDIDLGFTPATNLLPIRRLDPPPGEDVAVTAARFRWPEADLARLDQTYHRRDAQTVTYLSPGFSADLTVHPTGFVTHYPGLCDGEVSDEA